MLNSLNINFLPMNSLGLAAAPLNRTSKTPHPPDSLQDLSAAHKSLEQLTQSDRTSRSTARAVDAETHIVETPQASAHFSAALFAAAAPSATPGTQEALISLSAVASFMQQIDTGKLAFVLTVYSIVLLRMGFRDVLFPLIKTLKEAVNGKEIAQADDYDESESVASWTSWPPPVSSAPPTVIDRQLLPPLMEVPNQKTSQIAGVMYPVIDTPMIVWAVVDSAVQFAQNTSSPLSTYVPQLLALGLAVYSKRYRRMIVSRLTRHLDQQNVLLTAPAWRYHVRRPLGIFGPDVIGTYKEEEQYRIGHKYYEGETKSSLARGLLAFIELAGFATKLVQQVRYGMTRRDYNEEISDFIKNGKIQPADPKFLQVGGVLVRQWVINDADRKRANIYIVNEERLAEIPPGAKVICYGDHKSIWPDFWGLFLLETFHRRIRMVADSVNFATAWYFRFFLARLFKIHLVPYALMKLGLPYVDREGAKPKPDQGLKKAVKWFSGPLVKMLLPKPPATKHDWREDVINKMDMGIWPHIFPGATREEQTFHKDGSRDKTGILSTVANPKRPEQLLKVGIIDAGMELAFRDNKPVYLVFIKQDGSDLIAPKVGKGLRTHIQSNTLNQDAVYTIADITKLELDEGTHTIMTEISLAKDKAERDALREALKAKQLEQLERLTATWLAYTKEPELIRERYADWARTERPEEAAILIERFNERSRTDRRYLQIAGRMRTIHPRYREHRQHLEDRLHELLASEAPSDEEIDSLNWTVANNRKPKSKSSKSRAA